VIDFLKAYDPTMLQGNKEYSLGQIYYRDLLRSVGVACNEVKIFPCYDRAIFFGDSVADTQYWKPDCSSPIAFGPDPDNISANKTVFYHGDIEYNIVFPLAGAGTTIVKISAIMPDKQIGAGQRILALKKNIAPAADDNAVMSQIDRRLFRTLIVDGDNNGVQSRSVEMFFHGIKIISK